MDRQSELHRRAEALELDRDAIRRFSRHLLIPGLGLEGQKRLRTARVLVVGAGGLGAPILHYLAAGGVGHLTIVDPDRVDETNLQRQVLFREADIGRLKAEVAAEVVAGLSSVTSVEAVPERLEAEGAEHRVGGHDLVLDATDNFAARYLVNDACFLAGVPDVYGSIYQFSGRVSVFWRGHGPCYRCLHPTAPDPDSVPGCGEGGVLGALPGVVGSLMALEAMKWITGTGEVLLGRMAVLDARRMKWREILAHRNPACALCGETPTLTQLEDLERPEMCSAPGLLNEMAPKELKERLEHSAERVQIIDVRQPGEFELGHLPGATLLPLEELPGRLAEIDLTGDVVLYCKDERRTRRAYLLLQEAGWTRLFALEGGIDLWREEVDPSLPEY